ncbi:MAG: hypothetical protein Q4A07_03575 [Coriobacteriales bacterium]|nr:hypothetical protein [Coriobacteriales bacterium]
MPTSKNKGLTRALSVLAPVVLCVLCVLCLQLLCGCASKPGEEGIIDRTIKYASSRIVLDMAESSVAYTMPDAEVEISLLGVKEKPNGSKVLELEPSVVSDTMASWSADEWAKNRDDLFFNLATHFRLICKQAQKLADLPEEYSATCPDYMVVYDSKKSVGFVVTATGVYHKTEDPESPLGEAIVLTNQG